jgi:nucleotide-binding universal stress UspA family protein
MFERILVAIGGSHPSYEPARVAGELARSLDAALTILTVYRRMPISLGEPGYSKTVNDRLAHADAILSAARSIALAESAPSVSTEMLEGATAETIVDYARRGAFTMIVMGTRGRTALQGAVLGSVSAGVASHSLIPVLVVPNTLAVDEEVKAPLAVPGYAGC